MNRLYPNWDAGFISSLDPVFTGSLYSHGSDYQVINVDGDLHEFFVSILKLNIQE